MHITVLNNIDGLVAKRKVKYAVLEKCKVKDIDGMVAKRKVEYAALKKSIVQF